jgi:anti-anti-sigma factor
MIGDATDSGFEIKARFVGNEAVLEIHGEVDLTTAPQLRTYLDEAIDQGQRFVVLDLAGMGFMDGSGLRVIVGSARRLRLTGGYLSIRSPSPMVRRLLALVGLADLVADEEQVAASDTPDLSAISASPGRSPLEKSSELYEYLRSVIALPSNDEVVNGALRLVVALARTTVEGADGVSISLRRHERLSTVAASDQTILDMDAGQYETGEGPCIDASVIGRRFHAEFLDTETRWPAFTPIARALGIHAILSSPLVAGNVPVGALNIYSRRPAAFHAKDQDLATVFANEASIILTEVQSNVPDDQLESRLGEALRTRELISQAQGVIMERDGSGEDDAYTTLRRFSLSSGRPLRERAQDIVSSARRPPIDASDLPRDSDHA